MGSRMPERSTGTVVRAGARGLVGAMAMTGVRTVTAAVGPREQSPPEAIVEQRVPLVSGLPERHEAAVTELLHWTYGAAGGAAYGLLPRGVRSRPASGPVYGLLIWLGFEVGIAPLLGVHHAHEHGVAWRAGTALDHLLYGIVVGGRLAPEPPSARGRARRPVTPLRRRRSRGRARVRGPRS
ncbi:hypothetical protein [Actinomadura sp. 7K534]|uniref:hypothetical protein n=1 Tax=Actinomadura sp. 7K534 TaxID=2530366 RepID=UPI001A9DB8B6|nr:hypothetical protein [Actinomadura sp. 7K534]